MENLFFLDPSSKQAIAIKSLVLFWVMTLIFLLPIKNGVATNSEPLSTVKFRIINALDKTPLTAEKVVCLLNGKAAITDRQGMVSFLLPRGVHNFLVKRLDGDIKLVNILSPTPLGTEMRALSVLPAQIEEDIRLAKYPFGLPIPRKQQDPLNLPAFELESDAQINPKPGFSWTNGNQKRELTVTDQLPKTIKVARYCLGDSCKPCSSTPDRIDEIDFEDYVKGAVYAEIGVFAHNKQGKRAALETFKTLAVAARTYAYYFYIKRRSEVYKYHINDTVCNQRYEDTRLSIIDEAVDLTKGMVLVKKKDHSILDKIEYASSCGRYGTLPEYRTNTVPDKTGRNDCIGKWCGHNCCAAHEINPDVPNPTTPSGCKASKKCLVRGFCQWGMLERGLRGDSYKDIIAHYQPELALLTYTDDQGELSIEPDLSEVQDNFEGGQEIIDNSTNVDYLPEKADTGRAGNSPQQTAGPAGCSCSTLY